MTDTQSTQVLDSKAIEGGQDKFRIVFSIGGVAAEVGPYDTTERAQSEAKRLAQVADAEPKITVILTCSSVAAILRKFTKAEVAAANELPPAGEAKEDSEQSSEEPKTEDSESGDKAEEPKAEEPKAEEPKVETPAEEPKPRRGLRRSVTDMAAGRA